MYCFFLLNLVLLVIAAVHIIPLPCSFIGHKVQPLDIPVAYIQYNIQQFIEEVLLLNFAALLVLLQLGS